jgi:outer membrane murein-binding lipoprotein Lpp
MTVELAIKLSLSSVLSLAAIASLVRLLPYHFSQQAKLQELRTQVQETEARVMHLREQLSRNFDPQQTKSLMMEYSPRLASNQSRVFWLGEEGN